MTRVTLAILAVFVASGAFAVPIDQIRLERHHCYGWCPVDELILRADGSGEYSDPEAEWHPPPASKRTANSEQRISE